MVTPFTMAGALDEDALGRLVDFQIRGGVDMLLPCGTTGESPALEPAEWERVVDFVVGRVAGRVPVIAGAGSSSTAHAVAMTIRAGELGADGVLSVCPYYNRPQQEGYYQHFLAIAEASSVPVILYNVPPRTSGTLLPETTFRLAEHPNVVGIKEAAGSVDTIAELVRHRPDGFRILCGDDPLTVAAIAMGADGIVSVTSNPVPERFVRMVDAALAGEMTTAREMHYQLLPLMRAHFIESSPVPVKVTLAAMGLIEDHCRLPLAPASEATRSEIRRVSGMLGLLN